MATQWRGSVCRLPFLLIHSLISLSRVWDCGQIDNAVIASKSAIRGGALLPHVFLSVFQECSSPVPFEFVWGSRDCHWLSVAHESWTPSASQGERCLWWPSSSLLQNSPSCPGCRAPRGSGPTTTMHWPGSVLWTYVSPQPFVITLCCCPFQPLVSDRRPEGKTD